MRRIAWGLLLLFVFTIPWEISLNLAAPFGNIARIGGLALLLAAVPAVLQAGSLRTPGPMQWLVLALYLWYCCSYLWTIDAAATLEKMRGYFQELMIVWLVWEFAESPRDLRSLLRAFVAGSWVLAALTLLNFSSPQTIAVDQIRFVAEGQDPNDVARFLDVAFPLAALLLTSERRWAGRLLALGYFPLGLVAVLLTASRGGFLAALIALAGCGLVLMRSHARSVLAGIVALPALAAALWFVIPHETFERLGTIPSQLEGGDLNQRWNIWDAGWRAFERSPLAGTGAGSFVSAAAMHPLDTAHNTPLSIVVGGGLVALTLTIGIVALAVQAAIRTRGPLRLALLTAMLLWAVASLVDTVEENRTTWLLLGMIALSGRSAVEEAEKLEECFPGALSAASSRMVPSVSLRPAD